MAKSETLGNSTLDKEESPDFSREEAATLGKHVVNLGFSLNDFNLTPAFAPLDDKCEKFEETLDRTTDYKKDKNFVSNEEIHYYFSDKSADNLKLLKNKNPKLLEIYQNLCEKYPDLKCIKLEDSSEYANKVHDKGCSFSPSSKQSGKRIIPVVKFNLLNSKTPNPEQDLSTKVWMETIAKGLKLPYDTVSSDKKLFETVMFLHEFGHAHDFLTNAMNYNGIEKTKFLSSWEAITAFDGGEDFMSIFDIERQNREHEESLIPSESEYFANSTQYGTYDDFRRLQAQKYRDMTDEKYADNFAINYLLEYANK